jgi:hypothetical protein
MSSFNNLCVKLPPFLLFVALLSFHERLRTRVQSLLGKRAMAFHHCCEAIQLWRRMTKKPIQNHDFLPQFGIFMIIRFRIYAYIDDGKIVMLRLVFYIWYLLSMFGNLRLFFQDLFIRCSRCCLFRNLSLEVRISPLYFHNRHYNVEYGVWAWTTFLLSSPSKLLMSSLSSRLTYMCQFMMFIASHTRSQLRRVGDPKHMTAYISVCPGVSQIN